jgi:aspartate-semialdehyde dehydrogenase
MSILAIVHPTNLLGKELRETLGRDRSSLPWTEVRLLSTLAPEIGTLTEVGGAAALVQRLDPDSLEGVAAAFFCGPAAANRPLLRDLPDGLTAVILSPDATPEDGTPVVAGINDHAAVAGQVLLSPHPGVVLLAHLLHPLAGFEVEEAVATLVQPASLFDDSGIEELFEQSRQIIAMTPRRRPAVFGAQLAFNLLPAAPPYDAIARALAAVLPASPRRPVIAVQIVQGGVFHCLAVSLHLRCGGDPKLPALHRALGGSPYLEAASDPRHLGPIAVAASDKILLGSVRRDDQGFWLWAVMDNLTRGGALNALEAAVAAR